MSNQLPDIVKDWTPIIRMVTDALDSEHSRRAYKRALDDFMRWQVDQDYPELNRTSVMAYRANLLEDGKSPSAINQAMSAIRKLATEATDNGFLDPATASGIVKVKGIKQNGHRAGNWLTLDQAQELIRTPDISTPKGLRDRAILAVMIGAGLRVSEVAELTFDHIQMRDARWVIVDLVGKGNRFRTVPMPSWAKAAIDEWVTAAGKDEGRIFIATFKGGLLAGDRMTPQAVYYAVKEHSEAAGYSDIAPHDLRRTFAKLAHKGGAALDQIQLSLGHASIQTTERYLGVEQSLTNAPCDVLGLDLR